MHTTRTRTVSLSALAASAVVLLAACGGGSGGSSSSASSAAASASATSAAGSDAAAGGVLNGTVGPGFTISLDKTSVAAGTYTLNVDDEATEHNFHLTGAGVDVKTEVDFTGKKSFTVTLQPGTYAFVCDPHASSMKGTLTVT